MNKQNHCWAMIIAQKELYVLNEPAEQFFQRIFDSGRKICFAFSTRSGSNVYIIHIWMDKLYS